LKKYAISKLTGRSRRVEPKETQEKKVPSQVSKADSFEKQNARRNRFVEKSPKGLTRNDVEELVESIRNP
jgi:hypothetical protein